jgi:hypothetical protein
VRPVSSEAVFDVVHLGFHRQKVREGRAGFVDDGTPRVRETVLAAGSRP